MGGEEMKRTLLLVALLLMLLGTAQAKDGKDGLQPGDTAPPFSLPGSDGKTYSLADLEGRAVVIAWFPKAFTGG
jgi:peroxiredoxin Q/BCP